MPDAEQSVVGQTSGKRLANFGQTSGMRRGGNGGLIVPPFDRETAREAAARRWAGVSRAARLGLADAGEQLPGVSSRQPLRVIQYLVEQHALHAADPSARGSQQSFAQVVKLAYPAPDARPGDAAPAPASGDVAEMVAMWRAAKDADPALAERAAALLAAADSGGSV